MKRLIFCADNRSPYDGSEGYWKYMIDVTEKYAKKWNIEFKFVKYDYKLERHPAWERINILKTLVDDYDEIFWFDSDASIINHNIDIFDYIKNAPEFKKWERIENTIPIVYGVVDKPWTDLICSGIFMMDCSDKLRAKTFLNSWWNDCDNDLFFFEHPWDQYVWNFIWEKNPEKRSWIRSADIWTSREVEENQVFLHLTHSNMNKRYNESRFYNKLMVHGNECKKRIGIFVNKKEDNRKAIYLRILLEAQGHRVNFLSSTHLLNDTHLISDKCPYFIKEYSEINISDYCCFICVTYFPEKVFFDKIKYTYKICIYYDHTLPSNFEDFNEIWFEEDNPHALILETMNIPIVKLPKLYDPCMNTIVSEVKETDLEIVILGSNENIDFDLRAFKLSLELQNKLKANKIYFINTPGNILIRNHPFVKEKKLKLFTKLPIDDVLNFFKNKNVIFVSFSSILSCEHMEIVKSGFKLLHNYYETFSNLDSLAFITKNQIHFDDFDPYKKQFHFNCQLETLKPLLLTYNNKSEESTTFFIETLKTNKWDYKLIGEDDTWDGNLDTKFKGYLKYLKTLPESKYVILSDSHVLCVRKPKAFQKGFESFKKDIVVSMELFCEGKLTLSSDNKFEILNKYWTYNKQIPPNRKYVNGGLIAGKVSALVEMITWILSRNIVDNNFGIVNYMVEYPDKIAADYDALLLHTTNFAISSGMKDIQIQSRDSPTFAELMGRSSFFLHIPDNEKGQGILYKLVATIIKTGVNSSVLTIPYGWEEPDWNEKF